MLNDTTKPVPAQELAFFIGFRRKDRLFLSYVNASEIY